MKEKNNRNLPPVWCIAPKFFQSKSIEKDEHILIDISKIVLDIHAFKSRRFGYDVNTDFASLIRDSAASISNSSTVIFV